MNRIRVFLYLCLAASFLVSQAGAPAPHNAIAAPGSTSGVVIAQVYGGGGNSGATYTHDYILLFNAGIETVDLSSWSVQYSSAGGTAAWLITELTGSIASGQFFLIQEAQGAGGTTPLPTPDVIDPTPILMSATDGKVALVRNQTPLPTTPPPTTDIEDLVGFGGANYFEGTAPAPKLSNTTAALRKAYGCQDTDDNAADFVSGTPQPFNTASSKVLCGTLPAVTATLPADQATEVPAISSLTLTFNELVYLEPGALLLECPSGSPVAINGYPASPAGSVTLYPATILPPSATCTATVLASKVTDADLVAEHPASDHIFSFTVSEAPVVAATSPADNASGVKLDTDIQITFSEPVTPTGDWYYLNCTLSGVHSAAVSPANPTFTLDPAEDFALGETCTVTIFASQISDDDQDDPPDNMLADYAFSFDTTTCGLAGATLISDIQGTANPLALEGVYTIEAVVVGDYQQSGGFGGFFVQEEDTDADLNPLTSEGIFVYYPTAPDVQVGDLVRLTGTTSDYSGLTQVADITGMEVCATAVPLPSPASLDLPVENVNDLERYEGMRVTFVDPLTVIETFELGRYGQVVLAEGGRIPAFTHNNIPSVNGYESFLSAIAKRKIILDDGSSVQNPDPVIYPAPELTALNTLRLGDTIPSLTGILDYRYSFYRVQPTATVDFTPTNLRPPAPENPSGSLKVASANVLNYFNTFDVCYNGVGPDAVAGDCRGADDAVEFARQRLKIIAELAALDADIVGLMEIENDGYSAESALQDLVNGLNEAMGAGTYAFINPDLANGVDAMGTDYIRVALIYKPAAVTPLGDPAVLNTGAFVQVDDPATTGIEVRNRVPLAQTFQHNATRGVLTVVVNHLKSKGSSCEDSTTYLPAGDPDLLDGQGNCNLTRMLAAQEQAAWLSTDPTGSGDPDFLIIGDLNSYALEAPIGTLRGAGYTNLIAAEHGDAAYGYVYNGLYGYLDHALSSPSLTSQVAGVAEWHNNADEPLALDYDMTYKTTRLDALLYAPDAYRASDHDPLVVWLQLGQLIYLPTIFAP